MYIILVGKDNELNQRIQCYSSKKENSNEWSHSNVFFFFLQKKSITLRNTCKWVNPWGSECDLHVEWWCWGHSSLETIFKIRSVWHERPLVSRRPDNTIFLPDNIIWGLYLGSWSSGYRPFTRERRPKMTHTLRWRRGRTGGVHCFWEEFTVGHRGMEILYPQNISLVCQPWTRTSWHVSFLELFSLCVEVWWVGGRWGD